MTPVSAPLTVASSTPRSHSTSNYVPRDAVADDRYAQADTIRGQATGARRSRRRRIARFPARGGDFHRWSSACVSQAGRSSQPPSRTGARQHATRRIESCSMPLNDGGAALRADARCAGERNGTRSVRPGSIRSRVPSTSGWTTTDVTSSQRPTLRRRADHARCCGLGFATRASSRSTSSISSRWSTRYRRKKPVTRRRFSDAAGTCLLIRPYGRRVAAGALGPQSAPFPTRSRSLDLRCCSSRRAEACRTHLRRAPKFCLV